MAEIRILTGVAMLSLGTAVPLEGQRVSVETQARWAPSMGQPSMTVFGVVYDIKSGLPIEGVVVTLPEDEVGAVTDSLGRFGFGVPAPGRYTLEVLGIGYEKRQLAIEVRVDRAAAVEIGLDSSAGALCPIVVCSTPFGCDAVEVHVRDVLTGRAPQGPITLKIMNGTEVDSIVAESDSAQLHMGLGFPHQYGPFRVEVGGQGYSFWRRDLEENECGKLGKRAYRFWLFPN